MCCLVQLSIVKHITFLWIITQESWIRVGAQMKTEVPKASLGLFPCFPQIFQPSARAVFGISFSFLEACNFLSIALLIATQTEVASFAMG